MGNIIQQEIMKYTGMNEREVESFLLLLKKKRFLEADNSLKILLQLFETAYSKGKMDLLKELSSNIEDNREEN